MVESSSPSPAASADTSTDTVLGARHHARAQAGSDLAAAVTTRPTIPVQTATDLPDGVAPETVVWDETLGPDGYASRVVRRGVHLRITDLTGVSNLSLVLHHADRPVERLNLADTVKLQWNAYPGAGSLLLSDMGRVLATIVDGAGAIDLLCGVSRPRGRERLLVGLAKHGLTRRDLPPAANLFRRVRVADDGALQLVDAAPGGAGIAAPGLHLTLRAELALLVTLAVTLHPLDPPPKLAPNAPDSGTPGANYEREGSGSGVEAGPPPSTGTASSGALSTLDQAGTGRGFGATAGQASPLVRITAWQGLPAGPDDPARHASPEAQRAFENTDDVLQTLTGTPGLGLGQ